MLCRTRSHGDLSLEVQAEHTCMRLMNAAAGQSFQQSPSFKALQPSRSPKQVFMLHSDPATSPASANKDEACQRGEGGSWGSPLGLAQVALSSSRFQWCVWADPSSCTVTPVSTAPELTGYLLCRNTFCVPVKQGRAPGICNRSITSRFHQPMNTVSLLLPVGRVPHSFA